MIFADETRSELVALDMPPCYSYNLLRRMEERKSKILKTAVGHFVKTGIPITSGELYEKYGGFGIRPAMIRRELRDLENLNYLEKVHFSSGRIPTDKAYDFFVKIFLETNGIQVGHNRKKKFRVLSQKFSIGDYEDLVRKTASNLELLIVGFEVKKELIYMHGINELVSKLEFGIKEEILEILDDFELLDKRISSIRSWWENSEWPQVFIGRSPLTKSKNLSVIAERFTSSKRDFLFITIGPKRMDYGETLALFKFLKL